MIYHSDVDFFFGKRADKRRCAAWLKQHTLTDCRNQRYTALDLDMIRIDDFLYALYDDVFFASKFAVGNYDTHSIYTRRHMFKRNIIILKHCKHFAYKTEFAVHHRLFYIYYAVALFTCNTCDNSLAQFFFVKVGDYHCSGCRRAESIANIDWYFTYSYRKNRLGVKHICAHISEFSEFFIRKRGYRLWIIDNTRVCRHKSVDVRPVFI